MATQSKEKKKRIVKKEDPGFLECLEKLQVRLAALMNANTDKLIAQIYQSEVCMQQKTAQIEKRIMNYVKKEFSTLKQEIIIG